MSASAVPGVERTAAHLDERARLASLAGDVTYHDVRLLSWAGAERPEWWTAEHSRRLAVVVSLLDWALAPPCAVQGPACDPRESVAGR